MFEDIVSYSGSRGETYASLKCQDTGNHLRVEFWPHEESTQVVSRVFAVDPTRMKFMIGRTWASCMLYDCVRAEQHLPTRVITV